MQESEKQKSIVVLGGGTGSFMLLSALKDSEDTELTALVSMADDGGSTGVLRDELGVLPPGDVRQCLVALSDVSQLRDLFNYRFDSGTFGGHSFGNIFLSALEKTSGSFAQAVETASKVLNVNGVVLPATLNNTRLKMTWPESGEVLDGEKVIDAENFDADPRLAELSLTPEAELNPSAADAIAKADLIVLSPGDVYSSLGAILSIKNMSEALQASNAPIAYVCNLVTKRGQTDGFNVEDHAAEIERFIGKPLLDFVIYNTAVPNEELTQKYLAEGAEVVKEKPGNVGVHYRRIKGNFLGDVAERDKSEILPVTHSYIRHDGQAIAAALLEIAHGGN